MADIKKDKLKEVKKKCDELYEQTIQGSKDVQDKARDVCNRIAAVTGKA